MEATSQELYDLIKELQSLNSVSDFALAGGTSLAMRYNHRVSIDIDLFTDEIIGIEGMELISKEIKAFFKDAVSSCDIINAESGDQYCFLRAYIKKGGTPIKVELLQNMKFIDDVEMHEDIRILSKMDVGLFKLMSASNRQANKDIYDLEFITEEIDLAELLEQLAQKQEIYSAETDKCLFDLDNEESPVENLELLLEFDDINYTIMPSKPSHSTDRIDIVEGNKNWHVAKSHWRRKVHDLMRAKGIPIPPVKPVN